VSWYFDYQSYGSTKLEDFLMAEKLTYEELEQMVMDQILVIDDDDFILTLMINF